MQRAGGDAQWCYCMNCPAALALDREQLLHRPSCTQQPCLRHLGSDARQLLPWYTVKKFSVPLKICNNFIYLTTGYKYQIRVSLCAVLLVLQYLTLKIAIPVLDMSFVKPTNKGIGIMIEFSTTSEMPLTVLLPRGTINSILSTKHYHLRASANWKPALHPAAPIIQPGPNSFVKNKEAYQI